MSGSCHRFRLFIPPSEYLSGNGNTGKRQRKWQHRRKRKAEVAHSGSGNGKHLRQSPILPSGNTSQVKTATKPFTSPHPTSRWQRQPEAKYNPLATKNLTIHRPTTRNNHPPQKKNPKDYRMLPSKTYRLHIPTILRKPQNK